jgi:hypothetical protein
VADGEYEEDEIGAVDSVDSVDEHDEEEGAYAPSRLEIKLDNAP